MARSKTPKATGQQPRGQFEFRAADIARILGVTSPALERWKLKVRIVGGAQLYDIREAAAKRIQGLEKRNQTAGSTAAAAKIRESQARTELHNIRIQKERGQLLPEPIAQELWGDQIRYFHGSATTLSARAAQELCEQLGVTDKETIERVLDKHVAEMLGRISKYDPTEMLRRVGANMVMDESDGDDDDELEDPDES